MDDDGRCQTIQAVSETNVIAFYNSGAPHCMEMQASWWILLLLRPHDTPINTNADKFQKENRQVDH